MRAIWKTGRIVMENDSLIMISIANALFSIVSLSLTNDKRESVSKLKHQGQSNNTTGLCSSSNKSVYVHRWAPLHFFFFFYSFIFFSPSYRASWSSGEGIVSLYILRSLDYRCDNVFYFCCIREQSLPRRSFACCVSQCFFRSGTNHKESRWTQTQLRLQLCVCICVILCTLVCACPCVDCM